jgi:hypothetical protein|tara:strand:+ start:2226 stop:2585 length:360 start_codon:yes stop_codon:yes gene_type:complete
MLSFSQYLTEKPLTIKQRLARSRTMKRLAPKIAMKRKQAANRRADPEKLKTRAHKKAIDVIRKKILKDKDYNSLSYPEKASLEKKVQSKKSAIKKIEKKLLPQIKKAESERLKAKSKTT